MSRTRLGQVALFRNGVADEHEPVGGGVQNEADLVGERRAARCAIGGKLRKLLMAVRHVASVVDVERDARRRHYVGGHPLVDQRIGQADHVLQPRPRFRAATGSAGNSRSRLLSGSCPQAKLERQRIAARSTSRSSASW